MVCCFCLNCLGFSNKIKNDVMLENVKKASEMLDMEWSTDEAMEEYVESSGSICIVSLNGSVHDTGQFGDIAKGMRLTNVSGNLAPWESVVEPHVQIIRDAKQKTEIELELSDNFPYFPSGFSVKQLSRLDLSRTPSLANIPSSLAIEDGRRTADRSRRSSLRPSVISDWGEVFDGLKSFDFTKSGSLIIPVDVSESLSGQLTAQNSRLSVVYSPKKIRLPPGKVIGLFISKNDYLFQILSLNSSLNEVVDLFLCKESGAWLPISFSRTQANQPRIMSIKNMRNTLAENLGPLFDAKNQGLVFATGHINSKLCYKMSLCEMSKIESFFSVVNPGNLLEK